MWEVQLGHKEPEGGVEMCSFHCRCYVLPTLGLKNIPFQMPFFHFELAWARDCQSVRMLQYFEETLNISLKHYFYLPWVHLGIKCLIPDSRAVHVNNASCPTYANEYSWCLNAGDIYMGKDVDISLLFPLVNLEDFVERPLVVSLRCFNVLAIYSELGNRAN